MNKLTLKMGSTYLFSIFLWTIASRVWVGGEEQYYGVGQQIDCAHPKSIECDLSVLQKIKSRLNQTSQDFYSSWRGDNPCDGNWLHVECEDVSKNKSQFFRVTKLAFGKKHWYELEDGSVNFTEIDDRKIIQFDQALSVELTKMQWLKYMEFSGSMFSGKIFPEISTLKNLIVVDLAQNHSITGKIPLEISALENLQALDLYQNKLTGRFPENLSTLSNIKLLSATENNLTGSIPPEFSQLKKLEYFSVADNQINGSLPAEFSQLHRLKKLSLFDNFFTGSLPAQYSELSNLEKLYIDKNNITGILPEEFSELQNLEEFVVNDNQIKGSLTKGYSELVNLTKLSISNNNIIGSLPSQYSNLINLQEFYVQHNEFTGSLPEEYYMLKQIQKFVVSENQIKGILPAEYSDLVNLVKISVGNNFITGSLPAEYSTLINLKEMYIHNNRIKGSFPLEYSQLSNLTNFYAEYNRIKGILPEKFSNWQNLEVFSANDNLITGSLPKSFSKLVKLTKISVSNNVISQNLPAQYSNLNNLQELYVQHNKITGNLPQEYSKLEKLAQFAVSENRIRGTLPVEFSELVKLVKISVGNNKITRNLPAQYSKLTNLKEMYAQWNSITGSLPAEYSASKNLMILDVKKNPLKGSFPVEYSTLSNLKVFVLSTNITCQIRYGQYCAILKEQKLEEREKNQENPESMVIIEKNQENPESMVIIGSVLAGVIFLAIILVVLSLRFFNKKRIEYKEFEDDIEAGEGSIPANSSGLKGTELERLNDLVQRETEERNCGFNQNPSWWTDIEIPADVKEIPMTHLQERRPLGTGGFALVYEVEIADKVKQEYRDLCEKRLALKIICKEFIQIKDQMDAIIQEIEIMKKLCRENSEYVVQLIGASLQLRPSIVMELVPEGSLENLLYDQKLESYQKTLQWKLKLMLNISKGIKYLHSKGIIHRDLKPQNILIKHKKNATIKISDFGLSKIMKSANSTQVTSCVGTVAYMAPEMFDEENSKITQKVDIWALGVIMQEIIRGVRPWYGQKHCQIMCRLTQHKEPPAKGELPQKQCPQDLRELIQSCWNEVEGYRPSAEKVVSRLEIISNLKKETQEMDTIYHSSSSSASSSKSIELQPQGYNYYA